MMKWVKYALFLAIGLGLAWYASKDADFDIIWSATLQLNWFWAILSMVTSYVAMIIRGYRWNILLAPLGYQSRNSNNVHSVAFGYMMNDLIPRSGELARCAQCIKEHTILSAHDISEGGLIVTLLESAYCNNKGFEVSSNNSAIRKDAYWLGESQSRVVVSCDAASLSAIESAAAKAGICATVIGKVTNGAVKVEGEDWGNISVWKNKYDTSIENKLK